MDSRYEHVVTAWLVWLGYFLVHNLIDAAVFFNDERVH